MTQSAAGVRYRKAMMLVTLSSILVPAAGVLTSPMLARALGVAGRGELAVVLAPATLALAVATLGLPDALTYYVAKHPQITRRAIALALAMSAAMGLLSLAVTAVALPFLTEGNEGLGRLTLLATALLSPAFAIGVLRGAAVGHQMFMTVAVERTVLALLRVVLFGLLLWAGHLTVFTAVLVSQLCPIAAGLVYARIFGVARNIEETTPFTGNLRRAITSFGVRVWLGTVTEMLIARTGQVIIAPLSNVSELGLFTVAVAISDVPLIAAFAMRDALFGLNAKVNDAAQITTTSRMTVLLGAVGCIGLGATLPLWLGIIFGRQFEDAMLPAWMLMFSAIICIPGLMAAAGLSAWGRPGLTSLGMVLTLVANVVSLVLLVPRFGAIGAASASIVSNVVLVSYMVGAASRTIGVSAADFVVVRRSDVARVWQLGAHVIRQRRGSSVA